MQRLHRRRTIAPMRSLVVAVFLVASCFSLIVRAAPPADTAEVIVVKVTGIRHEAGKTLDLMIYSSEENQEKDEALSRLRAEVRPGAEEHTFTLRDVPPGRYMIAGVQDTNDNGDLDSGWFGIPKEGYFTSNDARLPSWEKCSFEYPGGAMTLGLRMIYW